MSLVTLGVSAQSNLKWTVNGVTDAWDVVDVTINQLYLELPLMVGARIHTASNFDLLFKGGPYLAYGVGGKTKIDGVPRKLILSVMMV